MLTEPTPAPLEVFTREKIHPDNEAKRLKAQLEHLTPLSRWKRFLLEFRRNHLHGKLRRARYNDLIARRHDCQTRLDDVKQQFVAAVERWRADRSNNDLKADVARLRIAGKAAESELESINAQIERLQPLYGRYSALQNQLDNDDRVRKKARELESDRKKLAKEARIIHSLLREGFRQLKRCHAVVDDRLVLPKIEKIGVDADMIYYKLATNRKMSFGWKQLLPYNVDLEDLVSESTLQNLSVICGRQIYVRRNRTNTAVYYCVSRTDSPGGIPEFITYREFIDFYPFGERDQIPIPVGVMKSRQNKWLYLSKTPHVLIAGETQSGKSNLVNCMISTLVTVYSPDEMRVVLIDNKGGIEFTHWHGIPHILGNICKTIDDVLPTLQSVMKMMYQRFGLLEKRKAKDIERYNRKADQKMPRVIVLIDELAALLGQGKTTAQIHDALTKIAAMGRAVGIHLLLCTQQPKSEVLPTQIKANLVVRITGAQPSGTDSMTVMGTWDAKDTPMIAGRMWLKIGADIEGFQAPYISDDDIAAAVELAQSYPPPMDALPPTADDTEPFVITSEEAEEIDNLPDLVTVPAIANRFTEALLIEIALNHFDGALATRRIFDMVRHEYPVTLAAVDRMVRNLVDMGKVTSGDKSYVVKPARKGYKLALEDKIAEGAAVA